MFFLLTIKFLPLAFTTYKILEFPIIEVLIVEIESILVYKRTNKKQIPIIFITFDLQNILLLLFYK